MLRIDVEFQLPLSHMSSDAVQSNGITITNLQRSVHKFETSLYLKRMQTVTIGY